MFTDDIKFTNNDMLLSLSFVLVYSEPLKLAVVRTSCSNTDFYQSFLYRLFFAKQYTRVKAQTEATLVKVHVGQIQGINYLYMISREYLKGRGSDNDLPPASPHVTTLYPTLNIHKVLHVWLHILKAFIIVFTFFIFLLFFFLKIIL